MRARHEPRRASRHRLRTAIASSAVALTAAAAIGVAPHGAAHADATTGNTPWLVLLCKAKGTTAEPEPPAYYQHLFDSHDSVNPTIFDYWWQVSNYQTNLFDSSASSHWIPTDKSVTDLQKENREQKLQDCMAAAGDEVGDPESYYGVIAMWNTNFSLPTDTTNFGDSGEAGGPGQFGRTLNGVTKPYAGVVIEPWAMFPSFVEHEMGHGYGLEHAFSYASCGASGTPGEYCDAYDTMGVSWNGLEFSQPAYALPNGGLGSAGPGLDSFELDKLGFIPAGRSLTATPGAGQQWTETLTSLSAPNASGLLTIKVPLGDSPDHYYTVEYRRKLNWDAGINGDGILIHEVEPNAIANHPGPLSYLVTRSSTWTDGIWFAGQTYDDGARQITITVQSVDAASNTATVVIAGPPAPPPSGGYGGGGGGGGGGAGGCGVGCGQHPPGWHPTPIHYM